MHVLYAARVKDWWGGQWVTGLWQQIPVGARRRPWIWGKGWNSLQE